MAQNVWTTSYTYIVCNKNRADSAKPEVRKNICFAKMWTLVHAEVENLLLLHSSGRLSESSLFALVAKLNATLAKQPEQLLLLQKTLCDFKSDVPLWEYCKRRILLREYGRTRDSSDVLEYISKTIGNARKSTNITDLVKQKSEFFANLSSDYVEAFRVLIVKHQDSESGFGPPQLEFDRLCTIREVTIEPNAVLDLLGKADDAIENDLARKVVKEREKLHHIISAFKFLRNNFFSDFDSTVCFVTACPAFISPLILSGGAGLVASPSRILHVPMNTFPTAKTLNNVKISGPSSDKVSFLPRELVICEVVDTLTTSA